MMTPLVTTQVTDMDVARMEFVTKLNSHILALREELRINELILESVLQSISSQTETMAQMNVQIHQERVNSARLNSYASITMVTSTLAASPSWVCQLRQTTKRLASSALASSMPLLRCCAKASR